MVLDCGASQWVLVVMALLCGGSLCVVLGEMMDFGGVLVVKTLNWGGYVLFLPVMAPDFGKFLWVSGVMALDCG